MVARENKKKKVLLLAAQGDKIPSDPIIPISPSFLPNSMSKTKQPIQKNGQNGEQDVTREIDQSDVATSQGLPSATRN